MEIKIGEYEQVHSATFMCEDNVPVRIYHAAVGDMPVNVSFTCVPEAAPEVSPGTLKWAMVDGIVTIKLNVLRNGFGTAFAPTQFGRIYTNDEPRRQQHYYFQIAHRPVGTTNIIHFSILRGGWDAL